MALTTGSRLGVYEITAPMVKDGIRCGVSGDRHERWAAGGARYKGLHKNTLYLRRVAAVTNLQGVARQPVAA